jgi:EpsI family protein
VFFGVVMLLLVWVGSFWQEAEKSLAPESSHSHREGGGALRLPTRQLFAAAIVAIALAGMWLPIEGVVARPLNTETPVLRALAGEGGWVPSGKTFTDWKPHYKGYASELNQVFDKDNHSVGLYLAFFRNQEKGRELITSGNLLVSKQEFKWRQLAAGTDAVDWTGVQAPAQRAEISGPDVRLEAYQLYWVNGTTTSSDYVAKALIAWSKLRGRGDDSALIVIYSVQPASGKDIRSALRDFASAMSPSIENSLELARGVFR